ncbi:tumor protein p53-inducible nuclear protein 2-like isoform X2 [Haliotis cracherodii]|uniref:tumor protein p53-inducible nuclear protein 2-like isoform X2 n=1 Tax=Haliotis rufescens TaxID=6454 RepID=UPI001EB07D74|nr:tumor protein p53-inducible nuclear protein 2-like isoform X2 [Haliotis rufescens]
MFSGVASLLFGSSSTEPETEVKEVDVPTRDAELGWVVVDLPSSEKSSRRRKRNTGVADSPMENLLIEHPSMSVYNSYGGDSTGELSNQSESSSDVDMEDESVAHRTRNQMVHQAPRRPHAIAARAGMLAHVQNVKFAQRKQRLQNCKHMSKKNIERSNKVKEYQSLGKRQSQRNRTLRPSGCMNGRIGQRKF